MKLHVLISSGVNLDGDFDPSDDDDMWSHFTINDLTFNAGDRAELPHVMTKLRVMNCPTSTHYVHLFSTMTPGL